MSSPPVPTRIDVALDAFGGPGPTREPPANSNATPSNSASNTPGERGQVHKHTLDAVCWHLAELFHALLKRKAPILSDDEPPVCIGSTNQ